MARGTVLVVDDDPAIVSTLREALEDEGYRVFTSVNGAALSLAHQVQPQVILLDIMMPDMDGLEVSRRLRANPATAAIPIVAMSAAGNLRALADQMPIDAQLSKPFNLETLYGIVARWDDAS
jgi:CheY-like chemotaxis protein